MDLGLAGRHCLITGASAGIDAAAAAVAQAERPVEVLINNGEVACCGEVEAGRLVPGICVQRRIEIVGASSAGSDLEVGMQWGDLGRTYVSSGTMTWRSAVSSVAGRSCNATDDLQRSPV
jgi:hypothetical protein